jgi:hypothetical protein
VTAVGDAGKTLGADEARKAAHRARSLLDQCKGSKPRRISPSKWALANHQEDWDRRDQKKDAATQEHQSQPERRRGKTADDRTYSAAESYSGGHHTKRPANPVAGCLDGDQCGGRCHRPACRSL